MRRRLTQKAWFGPKRVAGWGLTPVTWEGWAVTGLLLILTLLAGIVLQGFVAAVAIVVLIGLYIALAILTGDAPGGPRTQPRPRGPAS